MNGDSWHTYPSIFALGHHAIQDLLLDDVLVEEKIDGSQFSFGVFETIAGAGTQYPGGTRELKCRSKGSDIDIDHPEKMFAVAVEWCRQNMDKMHPGWTYRCEFLGKPEHNTLKYWRIPRHNLIVFDINTEHEKYLNWIHKQDAANDLDLEVVPRIFHGQVTNAMDVVEYLNRDSCLGETRIEGVVIKNYMRYGSDKKVLMGKYVSAAFKEEHGKAWKRDNPTGGDIILKIAGKFAHNGRWLKAVQHLRDAGVLTDSPKDIGLLIKEVPNDVFKEAEHEIMSDLMDWAWPKMKREITRGLAQWYKAFLLDKQFEVEVPDANISGDSNDNSGAGGSGSAGNDSYRSGDIR